MQPPRYRVRVPDLEYWLEQVPCQLGCPVHTDCGRYVQLIAHGLDREAYLAARAPNPLASVCARICAAPCEDRCRRGKIDAPVAIRALKRHVTERFGLESSAPETVDALRQGETPPGNSWPSRLPSLRAEKAVPLTEPLSPTSPAPSASAPLPQSSPAPSARRRVAVVGAGPAGLACAHDLAERGYAVTVFEASTRAGGMAFHGIPEFRLPRAVLDREIAAIERLGVQFRYQRPLTREFGLAQLRAEGFEAIFLAIGVQRGRDLSCPGRELDGIVTAVDFLLNVNNGYRIPQARKVLVVGGGFVAFDAARAALRALAGRGTLDATGSTPAAADEAGWGLQAAFDAARAAARSGAEVTLASLESLEELPAQRSEQGREEFAHVLGEGVHWLPQRSVTRFLGEGGRVQRAELIGVLRTYDDVGRFSPVFDETLREAREADLVILAVGQRADLSFVSPEDGLAVSKSGTIEVDRETLATSALGVYAGGDVAFGPRNLIDAEADGQRAARSIHALLSGAPRATPPRLSFERIPTDRYVRATGYESLPREPPPSVELGRRTGISEVELSYPEAQARKQAERCLACHIQTLYDAGRCVLCGRCVDVCPERCLKLVPLEQLDLPEDQRRAAERRGGVGHGPASAMLKDDERCIRCGLCAIRCPVEAFTMEVLRYEL